jgi:hypothetical protein
MVYALAAQSGGAALLSSRPGAGTAVELFLPVAEIAEAPARCASRSTVIGATPSCRVLLVEDDPLVSVATVAMLEEIGHRVLAAPSFVFPVAASVAISEIGRRLPKSEGMR